MSAGPPALRPRSTAAVVLTRPDPSHTPERHPAPAVTPPAVDAWPRWLERLVWTVLGLCVAAAWAALLLGDSLSG